MFGLRTQQPTSPVWPSIGFHRSLTGANKSSSVALARFSDTQVPMGVYGQMECT